MHCNTDRYFSATAAAAVLSRMRETESKDVHSSEEEEAWFTVASRCNIHFLAVAGGWKVCLEREEKEVMRALK